MIKFIFANPDLLTKQAKILGIDDNLGSIEHDLVSPIIITSRVKQMKLGEVNINAPIVRYKDFFLERAKY